MIKYFALIVVIGLEIGVSGVATAQTASTPSAAQPRRRVFNPFLQFSTSRLTVSRFGLPGFRAGMRNPFNQNSDATGDSATASSAQAPPFAALELEVTPIPVAPRPPFRPPVRSPYRPPPRPPF